MPNVYTVRSFRANLKQALDAAQDGTEISIMRGEDIFILRRTGTSDVAVAQTVVQAIGGPKDLPHKEVEEICPGHAMRMNCGRKGCKY